MEARNLPLPGLILLSPKIHRDTRGFFLETYNEARYQQVGVDCEFVQDNHSKSVGRARSAGMHFQSQPGQAKLVRVVRRPHLRRRGRHPPGLRRPTASGRGVVPRRREPRQLFVPVGFAHGFCVISPVAEVLYKVSSPYDAATECGFAWNDPAVGIDWPVEDPQLSARDQNAPPLAEQS